MALNLDEIIQIKDVDVVRTLLKRENCSEENYLALTGLIAQSGAMLITRRKLLEYVKTLDQPRKES